MENVESEVATLKTDINNIKELLLEIKQDIKNQPYVPRPEITLMNEATNRRIDNIEENQKQSKTLLIAWVGIGISIISVILSFFHK
jgi:hypothetical protein